MMRIRGRKQSKELAAAIDRGHRLFATGQEQEAVEFLQEAVHRFPDDPEIRLHYGISLLAVRPEDAPSEIIKAVELGPDDPIRLTRAAGTLLNMGHVEPARDYVNRAKELAPPKFLLASYLINLDSHFAALEGNDELAEEGFRLALEQEPDGAMFAVDLAQFLAKRDRQPEALEVIESTLPQTKRKDPLERLRSELLDK
jgi:Flp pilus assembly protein TadD